MRKHILSVVEVIFNVVRALLEDSVFVVVVGLSVVPIFVVDVAGL